MHQLNDEPNRRRQTVGNYQKILFVALVYMVILLSAKIGRRQDTQNQSLTKAIQSKKDFFTVDELLSVFELDRTYIGNWQSQPLEKLDTDQQLLSEKSGQIRFKITKILRQFRIEMFFFDGEYIDKGVIEYRFMIEHTHWKPSRVNETALLLSLNDNVVISSAMNYQVIFLTKNVGTVNITEFSFMFSVGQTGSVDEDKLTADIKILSENLHTKITVEGKQSTVVETFLFVIIMFCVSCLPFSAVMQVLKKLLDEQDEPRHYSLVTLTLATMWDAVLCIVAFVYAFRDQQSLILFFFPAFLLCLLFTNLQLRLMMLIFQTHHNQGNIRQAICKFNILSYGSFMLIYPVLLVANLNRTFFLVISCLMFPQIYVNGQTGHRPDPASPYYLNFLFIRFVIVFYLRSCPFNIFHLQPDYLLSLCCFCIFLLQVGLIKVQQTYGAKKIIPKFLLESIYNYFIEEECNIEDGRQILQCSICLNALHIQPVQKAADLHLQFKLMRTPCNHVYHTVCLIQWMKIKMECPQCRFKLPPYE